MITIKIIGRDLMSGVIKNMQQRIHKMREKILLEDMDDVPDGTSLISCGQDVDCGFKEEHWSISTFESIIWIDENDYGKMIVLGGDWEEDILFSDVHTMEDLRQCMFDEFNDRWLIAE